MYSTEREIDRVTLNVRRTMPPAMLVQPPSSLLAWQLSLSTAAETESRGKDKKEL